MKNDKIYDIEFYKSQSNDSYNAAKQVLPMFLEYYQPKSVIDVGCGIGTWLKVWNELGISKIKGLDCNNIDDNCLYIPRNNIEIVDLEKLNNNNNKYDLVMSIEVAEHIKTESSEDFVKLLISYGDVILFSASIPRQPGNNHINCQKPQFWVDLFNKNGYECFDFLRQKNMNLGIQYSPSQNMFLYVKKEKISLFENQGFKVDNNPMFFYSPGWMEFLLENNPIIKPCNISSLSTKKIISHLIKRSINHLFKIKKR